MAATSVRRTASRATSSRAAACSAKRSRSAPTKNPPTAEDKLERRTKPAAVKNSDESKSPSLAAGSPQGSCKAQTKDPSPTKKSKPNALVQRVYNTIDGELTKLERQKGATSQDRERASRALSQMVNALEKAVEMQRDMTKRKTTGGDAKSKEALAHAEDLRREIAERLERLNRKRAPGRRSE